MDSREEFVEVKYDGSSAVLKSFDGSVIEKIASCVASGVVIAPTETVYGILTRADFMGLKAIAVAKGRSIDQLPPVLISNFEMIEDQVLFRSKVQREKTEILVKTFWPGSLTLVFPMHPSSNLPSHRGVVAVRQTPNRILAEVSEIVGPLYASSANTHGAPTITGAEDLLSGEGLELLSRVGTAYCNRSKGGTAASTIIEVVEDGALICHREGAIALDSITTVLKEFEK